MTLPKTVLVTGSAGLIGSEICCYFAREGYSVVGVDNNMRAVFFGKEGDTSWNLKRLKKTIKDYTHYEMDLRDRRGILDLFKTVKPTVVVHAAAQPSHDLAAKIPFDDFDVNAVGTMNVLEAARGSCPEAPFIHMSTNKVYGDKPNTIKMKEMETRWEYDDPQYINGIPETLSIDQSTHSIFGASKVAGDILVQEYGRYFNMPTCCLRGGCLTGPNHSGVKLHGFLSYVIKCNLQGILYTVLGYKGKQVRDNIHSNDVAQFAMEFVINPRCGEVYNLGGGKENSCSILEAFRTIEARTNIKMNWTYVDENRAGDHICYYSDLRKIQMHYPELKVSKNLNTIIEEIISGWGGRNV